MPTHPSVEEALRQALADPKAFIEHKNWLSLLQDYGEPLSDKDQKALDVKRSEGKSKTFPKRVLYADRLHPDLYKLAEMVYLTYQHEDRAGKWFDNLPKNKSETIHKIGQWIVKHRTRVDIADVQSHVGATDLMDVMKIDGYADREVYYYLPQREAITYFFGIWGLDMKKIMTPTNDDVLRLLGIMLTLEEMREHIPDILNKRRDEAGWRSMDAAPGLARAVWPRLLTLFTDPEVMIELPPNFNCDDMRRQVDERAGEGFFDRHAGFNPNNIERLKLPWNESMLKSVLQVGRSDYELVMKKYIWGTGGGDGAPENFADWQNRHESWLLNYTPQQDAHLYLTIVFMWDKQHGFPLKPPAGKMPPGTGLDDEAEANDSGINSAINTGKQLKGNGDLNSAIKQLTAARKQSTNELLKALVGSGHMGGDDYDDDKMTSDEQFTIVGRIMEMRKVVKACDDDIIESKKKRTHIKEKYADIPSKRKKWLKKINKEIEQQEKVKATFKATMMQYTDKLAKLNSTKSNVEKELDYGDGDDDSSNSSGSDGSSDSEDSK